MKVTKRQLRRIIREEKQSILTENKIRSMVRYALLEKKKKKKKGKKDKKLSRSRSGSNHPSYKDIISRPTHHKTWNWWAGEGLAANLPGNPPRGAWSDASQPLFGGPEPMPEAEWGKWFVAPEEEGLGSAEEQYDQYLDIWEPIAAEYEAKAAEQAERDAYEASPEGKAEREMYRKYH